MAPPQAVALARAKGLDLVEISPTAVPPVCRIMDYGKYQYEQQKRARSAKKHQKVILVKEIKFRPKVDEHDYQFKKKHIERFLEDGDKVKATIFFRGREMAHPEIGRRILERLIDDLADVATPENMPRQEGNQMHTILSQKVGGKKSAAKPKAASRSRSSTPPSPTPTSPTGSRNISSTARRSSAASPPPAGRIGRRCTRWASRPRAARITSPITTR